MSKTKNVTFCITGELSKSRADVIQEIEDTIELIEIVEEVIELDIPEDIIIIIEDFQT